MREINYTTSNNKKRWDKNRTYLDENQAIRTHIFLFDCRAGSCFYIGQIGKGKNIEMVKKVCVLENKLTIQKEV